MIIEVLDQPIPMFHLNNLWYAEDGLEQHYGDKDDFEEASAILRKYERTVGLTIGRENQAILAAIFDLFVANED